MRRRELLAAAAASAVPAASRAAPAVGEFVPEIDLPEATGRRWRLSAQRGRLVVLQWVYPGCPFMAKHFTGGSLPALQREARARGVVWAMVESNDVDTRNYFDPPELLDWLRRQGSPEPLALMDDSGSVARAYGARTASHSFLVGPDGRLLYAGAIDSIASTKAEDIAAAVPHLRRALEATWAGRPVPVPVSRPYGCGLMLKGA